MNLNGISNQPINYSNNIGAMPLNFQSNRINHSLCMPFGDNSQSQSNIVNSLVQMVGQLVNSLTQMANQLVSLVTGNPTQANPYSTNQAASNDPMLSGLYDQQVLGQTAPQSSTEGWIDNIINFGKEIFGNILGGGKESSGGGFWSGIIQKGASLIGGLF